MKIDPVAEADRRRRLARIRTVANWLDDRFQVPGTNMRFGLDGLGGLVPGIGDTATAVIAAWIVFEARQLGVPRRHLAAMAANVGLDWLVGLVPLFGDIFDFAFKANRRNIRRILRYFDDLEGRGE